MDFSLSGCSMLLVNGPKFAAVARHFGVFLMSGTLTLGTPDSIK